MTETSLGLIMILKNERANLDRSLAPVAGCFDEVVVVDAGSGDGTRDYCRRLGARVYEHAWEHDFAQARNLSISHARADWLFWLDGDNAITPGHVAELRAAIPAQGPAVIWACEKLAPSGEMLWQKRCFPRSPEARFQGRVHEQLDHPAHWPQVASRVVVEHWGYADPAQVRDKGRYYQQLLNQMLQENPRDFYAHFQLARCLINQRDFLGAEEHLRLMIGDPATRQSNRELWAQGHYQLAQVLTRQGRGEQARQLLDELIKTQPDLGLARYHRGRLAYSQGDWERAAKDLARVGDLGTGTPLVDLDPAKTRFMAEYLGGLALERLGRGTEAARSLKAATLRRPDNLGARLELARVLSDLGRGHEAVQEIKTVLASDPSNRRAQRLLSRVEMAA